MITTVPHGILLSESRVFWRAQPAAGLPGIMTGIPAAGATPERATPMWSSADYVLDWPEINRRCSHGKLASVTAWPCWNAEPVRPSPPAAGQRQQACGGDGIGDEGDGAGHTRVGEAPPGHGAVGDGGPRVRWGADGDGGQRVPVCRERQCVAGVGVVESAVRPSGCRRPCGRWRWRSGASGRRC